MRAVHATDVRAVRARVFCNRFNCEFPIGSIGSMGIVQSEIWIWGSRCVPFSTDGFYCVLKPANDLRCVRIKEDGTLTRVFYNQFNGDFSTGSIGSTGIVQSELWIWGSRGVLRSTYGF